MAFLTSAVPITAEIFLSDEPCAIARTLTPFLPKAANIFPLMPEWFFMLSPTIATMDNCFSTIIGSTLPVSISYSKALSTTSLANALACSSTPTQIECSEEPCVISITLTDAFANASNNLFEKPGIPTMPLPSRLNNTILFMLEMPCMLVPVAVASFFITVPASSGAKVFFIQTGMPFFITGCIVGG